ncbi:DUF4389 domain-containing protein [Actinocrinis puniceicyclus]|uniref:DUF4389 domain-containing protein n=1 Tax=Actinocrinis puniceicyclus TaxID=977794 RepID=A0A8J8BD72_9ACTN|nr:DUF4389 domain-containing protein [Actinocrinis puniceicyclus]MBS2965902.1 DUF4389 domain-containing protein [Actinocrinis puniceicyclus]
MAAYDTSASEPLETRSPVTVAARLDEPLSRWLWLVKWLLAIPHYIILWVLSVVYVVLSLVAMIAIVFTGRYPRGIFELNVGILRWSWRVAYYSYGALGTDRYPPFTLDEVPDYPATLDIAYPQTLSRGAALVKWWLLAIPQYLVIGVFVGDYRVAGWPGVGLIGLLAVIAGVALAVTGRYLPELFDLIIGLDRWVLRVVAYASLMTDRYPPFRLDQGGREPSRDTGVPGVW